MTQSWWHLLRIWSSIGIQSFGGGATTLYLMRKVSVEEQHWLSDDEFSQYWGIVQIVPGINLLGQAVLIGYKIGGLPAALVALLGLLVPSISATMAITAGYAMIRTQPIVQDALRGIIPATVGIGAILVYQMLKPAIAGSRTQGMPYLVLSVAVMIVAPLIMTVSTIPTIAVLWGAGIVCAIGFWLIHTRWPTS